MKTQIIQLEAHDDTLSVKDKMGWNQASRIVLVWPKKATILYSRLDLLLIQRRSQDLGVQVALVTDHTEVRNTARQLNIPVFRHLRQAQSMKWRIGRRRSIYKRPERRAARPDLQALKEEVHPLVPAWYETKTARRAYYSITLLIFLAAAGIILPGAEIYLTPEARNQSITYQASASEHITIANLTGAFPVSRQSLIVEGQLTKPVTSTVKAPVSEAAGRVTFTNMTNNTVRVNEGSIVVAPESHNQKKMRYIITRTGTVPAGVGKTLTLPVQALTPGPAGNQPPDRITAIEGPLGLRLSVTNTAQISGGKEREISNPSIHEYSQLKEDLLENLHRQALEESNQLNDSYLPILPTLLLEKILDETYSPPFPEDELSLNPSEHLSITMVVEFSIQAVSNNDLLMISEHILNANLPEGYTPAPESLGITHLSSPASSDENVYHWKIKAERQIETALPFEKVVQATRGMHKERAIENLQQTFNLATKPLVIINPDWWPYIPSTAMRIKLNPDPPLLTNP
jgi:hypothetical protein